MTPIIAHVQRGDWFHVFFGVTIREYETFFDERPRRVADLMLFDGDSVFYEFGLQHYTDLISVTLLHHFANEGIPVRAVLFDYKQQHVQELAFAKQHCHQLGVNFTTIELPHLRGSQLTGDDGTWVVPNRNMVMLSVACNLADSEGVPIVSFAANAGDAAEFPDCRQGFVDAFNQALCQAELKVRVTAPFITWSKAKIARYASDMGIKLNEIWTCYKGGAKPCGECPACLKLKDAMA